MDIYLLRMKVELSNGEIDSFADDIYQVLRNIPLFYLNEVLELGLEGRKKDGEIPELDCSDSEDEEDIEKKEEEFNESEQESSDNED